MKIPEVPVGRRPAIALVRDVCAALDAEGVQYCHFKSNAFLDRSRTAENDLDLLIRRPDAAAFAVAMNRLGFKQARNPEKALPGVLDYYGYDEQADRLVHVHAHFQLIVGDDLTKNYRVPLERAFLEAAVRDGELPVPPPELELVLLALRLVLKHGTWDAVVARRARIPRSARAELDYLLARIDHDRLFAVSQAALPLLDRRTLEDCLGAVAPGAGTPTRIRAGLRLVRALDSCARRPRTTDVRLKLWRRVAATLRYRLGFRAERKRLSAGGAVIAVVGADGAGKSTAVEALHGWLAKDFQVTRVHLGKPPLSRTTRMLRMLALARSAPAAVARRLRGGSSAPQAWPRLRAALAVALARDRYRAARDARRIATNGALVVCDRFPLSELTLMDAPRIEAGIEGREPSALERRLATLERRYYRAMVRPDVVVVLRVDPEIAARRRPEDPVEFLRARWDEIWGVDWTAAGAHVIDAGLPADEVLAHLKSVVWSEV